jgi:hypothetical protein
MFTTAFWKDLAERSFSTFVQAFLGVFIAGNLVLEGGTDWGFVLTSAGIAGGIAVAKVIVAAMASAESGGSLLSSDTVVLRDEDSVV